MSWNTVFEMVLIYSPDSMEKADGDLGALIGGKGRARVIVSAAELKDFKKGEILVIDSIDPTMTFFAPLAAGIIERRGGMLIHGAIIAREYVIPCITGVVDATAYIHTGDLVTVDAYLGICTVQRVGSHRI
jgi:phosphohistidine swiveling domain-containing protein